MTPVLTNPTIVSGPLCHVKTAASLTVLPLRGRRHGSACGSAEVSWFGQLLHCLQVMERSVWAPVAGYWEVSGFT